MRGEVKGQGQGEPVPKPAAPAALQAYRARRNFQVTSEPAGGGVERAGELTYVIQKHWASQLHYDLRLELGGVMKSWAVPKGPSFDPQVKRMAVQVEDHPIEYADFEGTIPPKQYGAGKVIVWDRGTWVPLGEPAQGLRDGNLKFELHGHKLHGKWVLVRMKGKGEKQTPWLLIKEKDTFARAAADYSVVDAMPDSVHAPDLLPASLAPALATLVDGPPPDASQWRYEIKFDGYRLLARIDAAAVVLRTRNGHDWTPRLEPLRAALAALQLPPGWYDGEIVVPNDAGVPDFGALQRSFESGQTADIVYYLFDLPYFAGRDLRATPLEQRRDTLQRALEWAQEAVPTPAVRFSEGFDAAPNSVLASACKLGLEGVIGKRRGSVYRCGRSADWIKLKCGQRQEFVIGGYTDPKGGRSGFGSLLLGVHDANARLAFAGHVGCGFDLSALRDIRKRLAAIGCETSPFAAGAEFEGTPHFVHPVLVAEVSFGEWTRGGRIRHAVFRGLRGDKEAAMVVREEAVAGTGVTVKQASALPAGVHVTHPDRVIDASTGITKIELLRHYAAVGDLMMVHLKGRPVSLVRAPAGVGGELFFQKHADTRKLAGVRSLDPALFISHPPMLEVARKAGLLSAAQWNVVEFHTLNTGTASFEHPDRMVFDLDPGAKVAWPEVQEAAALVRTFLLQLGLAPFLKTSGGKGLHVVVPVRKVHDWGTVKGFSQAIVAHMAATLPQRFVAKSGPKNRVGKIFIDYLRNGLGATTVCAWSARARPGLGVSVPVAWSELDALTGGDHWTVRTVAARLAQGNAAWAGYARAARGLTAAMRLLGHQPEASTST